MTLAPEAGSQRLRNVIKKNISEEQILNAALTLYENGWSRIKFYFIAGLPTETLEDMDEMAELLSKIKYRAKLLKREKDLKHGLDITCTLSIFVPKPFTPFQWCPQMDIDKVTEHIKYLKSKTDKIKGVKINYHEKFVSIIEAVVTRGDERLCAVIEALYKKGCYLDSWGEYFDKDIWFETALEQGISLEEEAKRGGRILASARGKSVFNHRRQGTVGIRIIAGTRVGKGAAFASLFRGMHAEQQETDATPRLARP